MPNIIVTSRYMKSDSHAHIGNYVKYIATREGVAVPENNMGITKSQTKLIEKLMNDFPQSKELPEYEKYISQPTAKTASECISAVIDEPVQVEDTEPQEEILPSCQYHIKWSNEYKSACNALYKE